MNEELMNHVERFKNIKDRLPKQNFTGSDEFFDKLENILVQIDQNMDKMEYLLNK